MDVLLRDLEALVSIFHHCLLKFGLRFILDHYKWYHSLDLSSLDISILCMRPSIHYYYTRSCKEMASISKSGSYEEALDQAI